MESTEIFQTRFIYIFLFVTDQEYRKRGRREHRNSNAGGNRANQVGNSARRGDISVINGDCDGIYLNSKKIHKNIEFSYIRSI